jgi:hypothetical protein
MSVPSQNTAQWMGRFYALARTYGVEDIENSELIYANEARDARGETPEQVVRFLGWAEQ